MKVTYALTAALVIVASLLVVATPSYGALAPAQMVEPVVVVETFGTDLVLVQRENGEAWILRYGIGCISLPLYSGRTVFVYNPAGFFAGIGSRILIPDGRGACSIWKATKLGRLCWTGGLGTGSYEIARDVARVCACEGGRNA